MMQVEYTASFETLQPYQRRKSLQVLDEVVLHAQSGYCSVDR